MVCVAFVTVLAPLLVTTPTTAQTMLTLSGTVTTNDGLVIPSGVTVSLETLEGTPVAQQSADNNGQFSFEGLRVMNYTLTVRCKGFKTHTQEIQLRFGTNMSNVNVYLSPLNGKKVAKHAPLLSDESASKKSVKYFEKGERAFQRKKLGDAEKFFREAVNDSPCYARAWGELALVAVEDNRLKDAEAHFHKAIQCDGQFLDAYAGLAQLYKDEKRYPEAETVLQLGIQRSPATWQFYDRLGLLHYVMRKYKKSEGDFLQVLSLNPEAPPDVDAHLANAYLKEKNYDKAYSEMMKYMRADPTGRFAPSIKRVVKVMETHNLVSPALLQAGDHAKTPAP